MNGVQPNHPWRNFLDNKKLREARKERNRRTSREWHREERADPIYNAAMLERHRRARAGA